mmetsp:Transcript_19749/g.58581  ORF Transcript_19749/g.58581 Transcript_19749/m.58581 type:complete len:265 (+) Transcript_19749:1240-2034(+)
MPAAHNPVGTQRLNVDRHVRHRLAAVEHHFGAHALRLLHHKVGVEHRTQHIGHVHQAHQARARPKQLFEVLHVKLLLVWRQPHMPQNRACALRQQLPRHQVAVVLGNGQDYLIALPQVFIAPCVGHQVNRLASIARPHHLAAAAGIHKLGHLVPRLLVRCCRPRAEVVHASVHIGVARMVVIIHGRQHHLGLLARCSVVKVDQRLAIDLLIQDAEFGPQGSSKGPGRRRHIGGHRLDERGWRAARAARRRRQRSAAKQPHLLVD